jgi:hypothetical protein
VEALLLEKLTVLNESRNSTSFMDPRVQYAAHYSAHGKMSTHGPDDGGSKHFLNVGKILSDYTAQQPKRHPSSNYCT